MSQEEDIVDGKNVDSNDLLSFVDALASGNVLVKVVEKTKNIRLRLRYGKELPSLPGELANDITSEGLSIGKEYYNFLRARIASCRDTLIKHSLGHIRRDDNSAWSKIAQLSDMDGYLISPASLEIYTEHYKLEKSSYTEKLEEFIANYDDIVEDKTKIVADSYMRNTLERWFTEKIRGVTKFTTTEAEVAADKQMDAMQSPTVTLMKAYEVANTEGTIYELFTLSTQELKDAYERTEANIISGLIETLPKKENLRYEYSLKLEVGTLPNFKQMEKELKAKANASTAELNSTAKEVLNKLGDDAEPMMDVYQMKKRALQSVEEEFRLMYKAEIALKLTDFISSVEDGSRKITKSVFNELLGKTTKKSTNNKIGFLDKLLSLNIKSLNNDILLIKTKIALLQKKFDNTREIDASIVDSLRRMVEGIETVGEIDADFESDISSFEVPPPMDVDKEDDML